MKTCPTAPVKTRTVSPGQPRQSSSWSRTSSKEPSRRATAATGAPATRAASPARSRNVLGEDSRPAGRGSSLILHWSNPRQASLRGAEIFARHARLLPERQLCPSEHLAPARHLDFPASKREPPRVRRSLELSLSRVFDEPEAC